MAEYHIISDNIYFQMGALTALENASDNNDQIHTTFIDPTITYHKITDTIVHNSHVNLVIVFVSNVTLRRKILNTIGRYGIKVMVIAHFSVTGKDVDDTIVISPDVGARDFIDHVIRIQNQPIVTRTSVKEKYVIESLCGGRSPVQISSRLKMYHKSIYIIVSRAMAKNGIYGCARVQGILLCRDIIEMHNKLFCDKRKAPRLMINKIAGHTYTGKKKNTSARYLLFAPVPRDITNPRLLH